MTRTSEELPYIAPNGVNFSRPAGYVAVKAFFGQHDQFSDYYLISQGFCKFTVIEYTTRTETTWFTAGCLCGNGDQRLNVGTRLAVPKPVMTLYCYVTFYISLNLFSFHFMTRRPHCNDPKLTLVLSARVPPASRGRYKVGSHVVV
jgi:hypothetical protein